MNIDDVKRFAKNGIEEGVFSRELAQDEHLTQELWAVFSDYQSTEYKAVEEHVARYSFVKTGNRNSYGFNGYSSRNDKITEFKVFERNYKGYRFVVVYKGLTYIVYALKNGNIQEMALSYRFFRGSRSHQHINVENCLSMDDVHAKSIEIVKQDKRNIMNHYNKLIKDTKQEYRDKLQRINNLIKEV